VLARIGPAKSRSAAKFGQRLGDFGRSQSVMLEKQVLWRYMTVLYGRALARLLRLEECRKVK